jgi:hypothetical protein
MYATKLVNKNVVENNAYITVNDPYKDQIQNPFRASKRGKDDKPLAPFQVKVCKIHGRVPHSLLMVVAF